MDLRYNLVFLLILTSLVFWGPTAKASVIGTAPNVLGWKGEDIRLPCDFQEEPVAVSWIKESASYQKETKAGFLDGSFESTEERFNVDKNFNLVITDLEVADEGLYLCQVLLSDFQVYENSTFMRVNSIPSKHEIKECVGNSLSDRSRCSYQTPPNTPYTNLTCVVSGFRPNIAMSWTEESGKRLNSVVSQQTTLPDDTYERLETITVSAQHGTAQTFLCIATGDSVNSVSTAQITVLPTSGMRNNLGLIIGLAIGLPVAVVILFLLVAVLLPSQYLEDLRKGCGWISHQRRNNTQGDEEQGLLMDTFTSYPSLTKEQVQQCKEQLKAYYRETRRKVTVDPLNFMERVDLDEIFTSLSLVDQSGIRKIPITYDDLFRNNGSRNLSQRLLIQGEGGVGKTTLCSKIAWDWCHGKILQNVDMVLVIPLREVTIGKTIGSIVKKYIPDSNLVKPAQIDDYISKNAKEVLLVFDGFDEFDETLEESSKSVVIRILQLEQYQSCKVIVTTRPWRTREFTMTRTLADAYTYISVEGFNKGNVSTYIKRYFGIREKDGLAETLLRFMEENDIIRSNMTPFPIFCAMLCLMWNDFSEERRDEMQKMQTFSQIFGEMIFFLKEHYAAKFCKNLRKRNAAKYVRKASRAIQELGKIALAGILENKLSFPEEDFSECKDAMEICRKVGVLTKEQDNITRKLRRDANTLSFVESTFSFPHKLFQEYVAGLYFTYLHSNNRTRYEQLKKEIAPRYEEFRYLLYFASASSNELSLDIIIDLIKCSDRDFCVDVAFECHTEEAARAVGKQWQEYEISSHTSEHTKSAVVFMGSRDQAQSLHISNVNFGRTASLDLAEGMYLSRVLCKVDVLITQLHSDFYNIVGANSSNCQIQDLNLSFDSFDDNFQHHSSMGIDLARWVCHMPRLSTLSLTSPYFPDKFLSTAVNLASSCQLQKLKLIIYPWETGSQRQSSMGTELALWVCSVPSLSSFDVECYYLSDNFFSTAADLAQKCQIREIHMATSIDWNSEPAATGNLAIFLCRMPYLTFADLQCDNLPKEFFQTIVSQTTRTKLDSITVNGHSVTELISEKQSRMHDTGSVTGHLSLRKEQVQQCKRELKAYYRRTRRKLSIDPLNYMGRVDLDDIYTDLSLVDQRGVSITYNGLLSNDESGRISRRLLIQGEGGVGKTTLCSKIAWDWCQGRILQDLDMVIVIPLRDVTVDQTVGDIVKRCLPDSSEATPEQIYGYVSQNPSNVLLVFDGFDEFKGKIEGKSSSEIIRILGLEEHKSCKNQNAAEEVREASRAIEDISETTLVALMEGKFSFPEKHFKKCQDAIETCCKQSLRIEKVDCRRTMSHDLAKVMCTSPILRKVEMNSPRLHIDFYMILGQEASGCQIQDLKLSFEGLDEDSQHPSLLGVDLARWVCTMPNLSRFHMTSPHLPDNLLSTAADLASSCQILELSLEIHTVWTPKPAAAINLAEFLCRMPQVERANLQCDNLPVEFHKTIASEATSRKLNVINVNGVAVKDLIDQRW
ncbi:uncharacterized protein [Diadema setosum]|uniref:uncharacterized protein n=1 Tax=Diadema setosum TaxID=31175 RepID=UPI003B3B0484